MRNLVTRKYTRIRKNVARKLFNEGRIIYLTPSNIVATDSSPWIKPYPTTNRAADNFENIVNRYEFYNCNYELGYYTNFWISEEKEAISWQNSGVTKYVRTMAADCTSQSLMARSAYGSPAVMSIFQTTCRRISQLCIVADIHFRKAGNLIYQRV